MKKNTNTVKYNATPYPTLKRQEEVEMTTEIARLERELWEKVLANPSKVKFQAACLKAHWRPMMAMTTSMELKNVFLTCAA